MINERTQTPFSDSIVADSRAGGFFPLNQPPREVANVGPAMPENITEPLEPLEPENVSVDPELLARVERGEELTVADVSAALAEKELSKLRLISDEREKKRIAAENAEKSRLSAFSDLLKIDREDEPLLDKYHSIAAKRNRDWRESTKELAAVEHQIFGNRRKFIETAAIITDISNASERKPRTHELEIFLRKEAENLKQRLLAAGAKLIAVLTPNFDSAFYRGSMLDDFREPFADKTRFPDEDNEGNEPPFFPAAKTT